MKLFVLFCMFIALSPGLILTLPSLSPAEAVERGISFQNTGSVDSCISVGQWIPEQQTCNKAKSIMFSGQTKSLACLVHGAVFYIILKLIFRMRHKLKIAVLFIMLCPGLLLTLPNLSKSDCASLGTAENGEFCDEIVGPSASACSQCTKIIFSKSTNIKPIIVHALLFILICKVSKINL